MKRIFQILLIVALILSLCACSDKNENTSVNSESISVFPTGEMKDTVNGYRTESSTISSDDISSEYQGNFVANTSTKKFHKSSCHYAQNLDKSKALVTTNREELTNTGYIPCKVCNP